jgi:O-antigen/teichoic acid export membrane protein
MEDPHESPKENTILHNKIDPWEDIGFHKPIAGFWYNLFFMLINLGLGVVISGVLLNYIYPFPESMGYKTAAMGIFTLMFTIFDLGTHMTIDRFIAETRIKNVQKMVQYIQYFIWYQMCTGLVQTTVISIYALFYVPRTELAYGVWLMLIAASLQYPGFLGIFHGVIQSLQHYDKSAIVGFIHGEIFQRITEVVFVLLGRWYGLHHPELGEIMGIAIGAAIGTYIDDFIAMLLAAKFFKDIMNSEGITVGSCFRVSFTWHDIKEPFFFGLKTGFPGLVGALTGFLGLWYSITYIPQYTTFNTLYSFAGTFMWMMATASPAMIPLYSEAYLNGKKKLSEFYVKQTFRFIYLTMGIFVTIFLIVLTFLESFLLVFNLVNYVLIVPFVIPIMIRNLLNAFAGHADQLLIGTNNPNFLVKIRLIEEILKIGCIFVIIVWLQIPVRYGLSGLIFFFVFWDIPAVAFKTIATYIYLNRNVLKIRIAGVQTFGAPFVASLITFLIASALNRIIVIPLIEHYNFIVGIIPFALILLGTALYLYFPLTVFFGGWDDKSVETFRRVVGISGPSKFLVYPMLKLVELFVRFSLLHNRFSIPTADAEREADELLQLKFHGLLKSV